VKKKIFVKHRVTTSGPETRRKATARVRKKRRIETFPRKACLFSNTGRIGKEPFHRDAKGGEKGGATARIRKGKIKEEKRRIDKMGCDEMGWTQR